MGGVLEDDSSPNTPNDSGSDEDSMPSVIVNNSSLDEPDDVFNSNKKRDGLKRQDIHPPTPDWNTTEEEGNPDSAKRTRSRIDPRHPLTNYSTPKSIGSKKGPEYDHKSPHYGNSEFINSPPHSAYKQSSPLNNVSVEKSCTSDNSALVKDEAPIKNKEYGINKIQYAIILAVFVGLVGVALCTYKSESIPKTDGSSLKISIYKKLSKLKNKFPSVEGWAAINVCVSKIFDQTEQPGVLLLMGESESSTNCFAKELLNLFHNTPEDVNNLKTGASKFEDLHSSIDKSLISTKSYGLLNIDKLDGESAMVFHGFCDNENSPHPNSLIVLTLTVPNDTPFQMEKAESIAEELLMKQWTPILSEDKASPLISRINGFNAYVSVGSVSPCPS